MGVLLCPCWDSRGGGAFLKHWDGSSAESWIIFWAKFNQSARIERHTVYFSRCPGRGRNTLGWSSSSASLYSRGPGTIEDQVMRTKEGGMSPCPYDNYVSYLGSPNSFHIHDLIWSSLDPYLKEASELQRAAGIGVRILRHLGFSTSQITTKSHCFSYIVLSSSWFSLLPGLWKGSDKIMDLKLLHKLWETQQIWDILHIVGER